MYSLFLLNHFSIVFLLHFLQSLKKIFLDITFVVFAQTFNSGFEFVEKVFFIFFKSFYFALHIGDFGL